MSSESELRLRWSGLDLEFGLGPGVESELSVACPRTGLVLPPVRSVSFVDES